MCCGTCERAARRDPDPWRNASVADDHAHKLEQVAFRTRPQRQQARFRAAMARNARAAAEAFEVAADAWEEVDELVRADLRRNNARRWYTEAFLMEHAHLSHGFYLITDAEARELASKVNRKPPPDGRLLVVPLTPVGPEVHLHRLSLHERELWALRRKRPWVYAIAGVR